MHIPVGLSVLRQRHRSFNVSKLRYYCWHEMFRGFFEGLAIFCDRSRTEHRLPDFLSWAEIQTYPFPPGNTSFPQFLKPVEHHRVTPQGGHIQHWIATGVIVQRCETVVITTYQ